MCPLVFTNGGIIEADKLLCAAAINPDEMALIECGLFLERNGQSTHQATKAGPLIAFYSLAVSGL
jgi:hypothetical protein